MAHDVFVSHSAKDKAVAEQVVAHLERESVRCWVAPRDVFPGADWGESIIEAIESSRIMVLVFSKNANASSQIKREVERAVDKDVYTIPFRVDDIEPTRSLEYFISSSQWMDAFIPPLEPHLDRLARTVKAVLARNAAPAAVEIGSLPPQLPAAPISTQPSNPSSASPGWLKPAAIALGVLLVAAAAWYAVTPKSPDRGAAKPDLPAQSDETPTPPTTTVAVASPTATAPTVAATEYPNVMNKPANPRAEVPDRTMMNESAAAAAASNRVVQDEPASNLSKRSSAISHLFSANKKAVTEEEPSAVVQRYYESINRRALSGAYDCLSTNFKARLSSEQFEKVFAETRAIAVRRVDSGSRDSAVSSVDVSFLETDADNVPHEWNGNISLVKEEDGWRIERTQLNRAETTRTPSAARKY